MRSFVAVSLVLPWAGVVSAATGWTYLGCYVDSTSTRTLKSNQGVVGGYTNMTVENCEAACKSAGYALAGVEYSQECWCDNVFENGVTTTAPDGEAQCSSSCKGNAAEICGGGNRLNVYSYGTLKPTSTGTTSTTSSSTSIATTSTTSTSTTTSRPSSTTSTASSSAPTSTASSGSLGWTLLGCYSDNTAARTLNTRTQVTGGDGQMTVEACTAACKAAGYALAGVEYSGECYCDSALRNGGATATDGNAQCTMTCNGNPQETCGGPNRLDLYTYAVVSSSLTMITTTSSPTSTSTSIRTSTSTSTSISTSTSTSKSTSTTSSSSAATKTSAAAGWTLLGCYTDSTANRILSQRTTVTGGDAATTVELCQAACASAGYAFAGVEYSGECYCDSAIRNGGATATDGNAQCTMTCNGNAMETCGGPNRLDLYSFATMTGSTSSATTSKPSSTTSSKSSSTTSSIATTSAAGGWTLLGCYADSTASRVLSVRTTVTGGDAATTVELCETACLNAGYTFSGVEFSGECYCDSAIRNGGATATDGNAQCTMTCNGNPKETCGGSNRIDLYSYNSMGAATSTTKTSSSSTSSATPTASAASYWMADIAHQGIAPYQSTSGYQVFRNVKDYGAKGDGVTDDTQAINNAISAGGRCAPNSACKSTTTTPVVVYFPAGTYLLSSSIVDYYLTQLIGNPNNMPILKATANFNGFGLIDGNQYGANGLGFGATNLFYRQVRNFVFDITGIAATTKAYGIHWPTAQATSLQNCLFIMSDAPGTLHQGVFIEQGSGGYLGDLVFRGGVDAVTFGNQQFTVRNLTISNAVTAINQIWDWGWTYKSITIKNCSVGLDISAGGSTAQTVGSVTFIDSSITDTALGIKTAHNAGSSPATAGSLVIENVKFSNVPIAIQGPGGSTDLAGTSGSMTVSAWGQGHEYTPNGPVTFEGPITAFPRPASLLSGSYYYERSKPQYSSSPVSAFLSIRSAGAAGNGVTDDTAAINQALQSAAQSGKIVYFDAGTYMVTGTIYFPSGSRVVGETYPVIMGSGTFFSNVNSPQPVVQVGKSGETGVVEWSDMIVATQGATAGATLIEWNLASSATSPSGMWDVHTRIGGFAGSNLQVANCPTSTAANTAVNTNCIAAFMSMHVTKSASGLYMENVWLWTADHDIEDPNVTMVTIYAGRGLYVESQVGNIWLVGTAVEHHTLYQYQFASTTNIFMGQIQTETAYYQPNPPATSPFTSLPSLNDPDFNVFCSGKTGNCASGWGVRVLGSSPVLIYGAGLYSFFSNYATTCSASGNGEVCQTQIFGMDEGGSTAYSGTASQVYAYNLNTIGSVSMVDVAGTSKASYADNVNVFPDTIALFRTS